MAKKKIFGIPRALSTGIGETISAGNNNVGQLRYEIISLAAIELDQENPRDLLIDKSDVLHGVSDTDFDFQRKRDEISSLETLSFSIKKAGIRNPIEVYKDNENYKLISGERRVLASLLAGKIDIPAKVLDTKPDELQLRFLQWIENIERQDLTIWERLHNVEQLVHAYRFTSDVVNETILSQLIGCSTRQSKRYLDVISASPELKKSMKEAGISDLIKLSMIVNAHNPELQSQLIAEAARGTSREDIINILKEVESSELKKKVNSQKIEKKGRGRPKEFILLNIPVQKKSSIKNIFEWVLENPRMKKHEEKFNFFNLEDENHIKKAFQLLLDLVD